jgi:hypothetical protein
MARPYRLALAAAGVALVVAAAPLAVGALAAGPVRVCIDNPEAPTVAPNRDDEERRQREHASRVGFGLATTPTCRFEVSDPRPPGAAWAAVLLASAAAGAAAWWLSGGVRTGTAPAAGAAATGSPRPQPPAPVGPVALTPFGEHGGYVDLPHGVVVWATQEPTAPDAGALRPGEPVHIQPGPNRSGWVVGRDPFTPRGSDR